MSHTTPAPKATKGERTRSRILDAALAMFSEQGFHNTSLRDIAARADITHVGLLHHFESKDIMLVRVLEHREQYDRELLRTIPNDADDSMWKWMMKVIRLNLEDPTRIRLFVKLSAEATDESHPAHEYFTRRYRNLISAAEQRFARTFSEQPPLINITARQAAESIMALVDGLQLQWLLSGGSVDIPTIVSAHLRALGVDSIDEM